VGSADLTARTAFIVKSKREYDFKGEGNTALAVDKPLLRSRCIITYRNSA
jgi:hypothetical protein